MKGDWKDVYVYEGENDVILGKPFGLREFKPWESTSREQAQEWYTEGWEKAKAEEQEKGRVPFLLDALIQRMKAADEWYGTDFEEPIAIVEQALQAFKKGT
jgi:hypothetical protein